MTTIWEHSFPPTNQESATEFPHGAVFLSGLFDDEGVHLWYEVDPKREGSTNYRFRVVGTGWPQDRQPHEHWKYLFTFTQETADLNVQVAGVRTVVPLPKRLVWHVYEIWNKWTGE